MMSWNVCHVGDRDRSAVPHGSSLVCKLSELILEA
jgi:hypothetical protein